MGSKFWLAPPEWGGGESEELKKGVEVGCRGRSS